MDSTVLSVFAQVLYLSTSFYLMPLYTSTPLTDEYFLYKTYCMTNL